MESQQPVGDVDAQFESMIRAHARSIGYALHQVLRPPYRDLIPDAEQEIYLAVWDQLKKGKDIAAPASYLYKVALRVALKLKKKAMMEVGVEAESLEWMTAQSSEPTLHKVESLKKALAGLPAESERAIRAYLIGYDFREVAALFNWTESVARHRIYRGIKKLKKRMWELHAKST